MRRIWLLVLICGLAASFALAQDKPCRPNRHAKLPNEIGTTLVVHQIRNQTMSRKV